MICEYLQYQNRLEYSLHDGVELSISFKNAKFCWWYHTTVKRNILPTFHVTFLQNTLFCKSWLFCPTVYWPVYKTDATLDCPSVSAKFCIVSQAVMLSYPEVSGWQLGLGLSVCRWPLQGPPRGPRLHQWQPRTHIYQTPVNFWPVERASRSLTMTPS